MGDLQLIKKAIYEEDRVPELLELLGCKYVHFERGIVAGSLPDGNNKRSVQVKLNEHLNSNIRTRGGIKGDIFSIVSYIKYGCTTEEEFNETLYDSKIWIAENMGYMKLLGQGKDQKEKPKYNSWLKDLKKRRKKEQLTDIVPNKPIDESIKNNYRMIPYYKWIQEGINYDTQVEWEVGFDWESHRIITLIRNINGELIGVKGRAMDDDNPWKYLYIEEMNKSIELFGLHKTITHILDKKEVIIFEGYKSVMKSWQYDFKNCCSIEGDDISPAQVSLIKSFGLDVSVVLCFDKDKTESEIKQQAAKFGNRKVYYTYDYTNLLSDKDSPVDRGVGIFEELLERKIEFTS